MTGVLPPALLKRGQQGRRCVFVIESQIILWFFKINLKLIAAIRAPLNSEWFSITFAIIFLVGLNIVAAQIQAQLVTIFVLYKFPLPSTLSLHPPALPLFRRP